MIECLAARMTLSIALDLGLSSIILEGDSWGIISLLLNLDEVSPWNIYNTIHDCHALCMTLNSCRFMHAKRCENVVADRIAKHAALSQKTESWSSLPPVWLKEDLYFDFVDLDQLILT